MGRQQFKLGDNVEGSPISCIVVSMGLDGFKKCLSILDIDEKMEVLDIVDW